ncbi:MAG: polysaccharide deacetylase family protein [Thiohalospira sp.]
MTAGGLRDRLADFLARGHLLGPLGRLWHALNDGVVILAYHRVVDMGREEAYPGDPELVTATPEVFDTQMAELRRYYQPVPLDEVWRRWSRGQRLPRRAVAVTFDDGFADNATEALPLLQRHGIPATIFVSSGYVGQQGTFWFEDLVRRIRRSPAPVLEVAGEGWPLGSDDQRRRAAGAALGYLKRIPEVERRRQIEEWQGVLGQAPAPEPAARPLTREQIRGLVAGGVAIGSHSVSHPVLTACSDGELRRELIDSRRDLEALTGAPVTTLSYPVGGHQAHDERVRAAAREAGYRLACAYVSGFNRRRDSDLFALRRQRVERYLAPARFSAMVACPEVFR